MGRGRLDCVVLFATTSSVLVLALVLVLVLGFRVRVLARLVRARARARVSARARARVRARVKGERGAQRTCERSRSGEGPQLRLAQLRGQRAVLLAAVEEHGPCVVGRRNERRLLHRPRQRGGGMGVGTIGVARLLRVWVGATGLARLRLIALGLGPRLCRSGLALAINSSPSDRSAARAASGSAAVAPRRARAASHSSSVLTTHCLSSHAASSLRSWRSRAAIPSCRHIRRHWRATSGCGPASSFARSR